MDLAEAMRVLDDPGHAVEAQDAPHQGQYKIVGRDPGGSRLLAVAASITYPDEEGADGVGHVRVHTAWDATPAERRFWRP